MAKLTKLSSVQTVLSAVFELNATDTMVNVGGTEVAFGKTTSGSNTVYDVVTLPPGAIVIGGAVKILTAWAGTTTPTLDVGDVDDTDRYTETNPIALDDPDAPITGFDLLGDHVKYATGKNIRLTFSNTSTDATAGKIVVVVNFIVPGRASENVKTT